MVDFDENDRRDRLNRLLRQLATDQNSLQDKKARAEYFIKLESIYHIIGSNDNFRHFYSDIFSTITIIDAEETDGGIDILAQNVQALRDGYKSINKDPDGVIIDISKSLSKLNDHINLEIARINYTKQLLRITQSEQEKSAEMLDEINDHIVELDRNTDEMERSQKKMQNEYITILGIFASIVLAFTGGMTFSNSVMSNIAKASIYRIFLITPIVGLIVFDLIWALLDFIGQLNDKKHINRTVFTLCNLAFSVIIFLGILALVFRWFG